MSARPVTFDMSSAQPIAAPVTFDMSTVQPINSPAPNAGLAPPAGPSMKMDSGEGPIAQNLTSFETQLSNMPKALAQGIARPFTAVGKAATLKEQSDEQSAMEQPGIMPALQNIGGMLNRKLSPVAKTDSGTPNEQVDYGATAANLLPFLLGGRKAIAEMPEGLGGTLRSGASSALRSASDIVSPDVTGIISPRLAHAQRLAGRLGEALAPKATNPGAPFPETPSPEVLQSKGLAQGAQQVPPDPAAGLGQVRNSLPKALRPSGPAKPAQEPLPDQPSAAPAPVNTQAATDQHMTAYEQAKSSLGPNAKMGDVLQAAAKIQNPNPQPTSQLDTLLQNAVGNKPVKPGVSMKNQASEGPTNAPANLPAGHTPSDSSALTSYKYDPAAREFHVQGKGGTVYTYGDVSPEDAQAFEANPSKGKAWQAIKQKYDPPIRKNGAPVIPTGARSSSPGDNDLTRLLQQSVAQARGAGND